MENIYNIYKLVQNPIFLSAFFSWFISQLIKSIIDVLRHRPNTGREIVSRLLWSTGGMPSSHSAVVTSLTTSLGFKVGIDSPIFIVALFYCFLTIRDALGVRQAAGVQATTLNRMIYELSHKMDIKINRVKEIHGHKFSEVSMGILLGFFIAVAFCNL